MNRHPLVLGILGGMGPLATADVYSKVVAAQTAQTDQESIGILVYALPSIPDRSAALLGEGSSPLPALQKGVSVLSAMGATHLLIACNTAHAFLDSNESLAGIRVVNMIFSASNECRRVTAVGDGIAILGTAGLYRSCIYQKALAERGRRTIDVDPIIQDLVTNLILSVKASQAIAGLERQWLEIERRLVGLGVDCAILACTELAMVADLSDHAIRIVDPAIAVAQEIRCIARTILEFGAAPDS